MLSLQHAVHDRQDSKTKMVRHPGIEPGASAWEAPMLPLHQWRRTTTRQDNRHPPYYHSTG